MLLFPYKVWYLQNVDDTFKVELSKCFEMRCFSPKELVVHHLGPALCILERGVCTSFEPLHPIPIADLPIRPSSLFPHTPQYFISRNFIVGGGTYYPSPLNMALT